MRVRTSSAYTFTQKLKDCHLLPVHDFALKIASKLTGIHVVYLTAIKTEPREEGDGDDDDNNWTENIPETQLESQSHVSTSSNVSTAAPVTCNAQLVQLQDGSYAYITSSTSSQGVDLNTTLTESVEKQEKPKAKKRPKVKKPLLAKTPAPKSAKISPKRVTRTPKVAKPTVISESHLDDETPEKEPSTRRRKASMTRNSTGKRAQSNRRTTPKIPVATEEIIDTTDQLSTTPTSPPPIEASCVPPEGILEEANEEEQREIMLKLIPPEMRLKCGKPRKGRLGKCCDSCVNSSQVGLHAASWLMSRYPEICKHLLDNEMFSVMGSWPLGPCIWPVITFVVLGISLFHDYGIHS